jgi:hypothetical protein
MRCSKKKASEAAPNRMAPSRTVRVPWLCDVWTYSVKEPSGQFFDGI